MHNFILLTLFYSILSTLTCADAGFVVGTICHVVLLKLTRLGDTRHWVTGSMGHLGHLSRPGLRVTGSSF